MKKVSSSTTRYYYFYEFYPFVAYSNDEGLPTAFRLEDRLSTELWTLYVGETPVNIEQDELGNIVQIECLNCIYDFVYEE